MQLTNLRKPNPLTSPLPKPHTHTRTEGDMRVRVLSAPDTHTLNDDDVLCEM